MNLIVKDALLTALVVAGFVVLQSLLDRGVLLLIFSDSFLLSPIGGYFLNVTAIEFLRISALTLSLTVSAFALFKLVSRNWAWFGLGVNATIGIWLTLTVRVYKMGVIP